MEDDVQIQVMKNDCSRLMQMMKELNAPADAVQAALSVPCFVVQHNWNEVLRAAGVIGDELIYEETYRLPAPQCFFEFKVNIKVNGTWIVHYFIYQAEEVTGEDGLLTTSSRLFAKREGKPWWLMDNKLPQFQPFMMAYAIQVASTCVAMEAELTERTAHKLSSRPNRTLPRVGHAYHVVHVRKHRGSHDAGEYKGIVRLHFRRGHWRMQNGERIWIKWTLVGNPDLGFIDKEYRV